MLACAVIAFVDEGSGKTGIVEVRIIGLVAYGQFVTSGGQDEIVMTAVV